MSSILYTTTTAKKFFKTAIIALVFGFVVFGSFGGPALQWGRPGLQIVTFGVSEAYAAPFDYQDFMTLLKI